MPGPLLESRRPSSRRKYIGRRCRWLWLLLCLYPCGYLLLSWYVFAVPLPEAPALSLQLKQLERHLVSATPEVKQSSLSVLKAAAFQHRQERSDLQKSWIGDLLSDIVQNCEILDCHEDASLLKKEEWHEKLFVAANLYNCESMMPNFIYQMLRLISLHGSDQIRVSVYESGSSDTTPQWLLFFEKLLEILGVHSRIVVNGSLVRSKDVDRIVLLAQLRNAAMAPLHEWSDSWRASKVVFVNDVFFCAQHVLRLVLHEADVACGMDFAFCIGCLPRSMQKRFMQTDLMERYHLPEWLAFQLPKIKSLLRNWRTALPLERRWHLGVPMVFYDRWVTHDMNGKNFLNAPPYINDTHTAAFLTHGYPVYVHSCWNGIVSIASDPFYSNLQFRAQFPEECQASECFFLCHDFALLHYDRILVDPGVRVAYGFRESTHLYDPSMVANMHFLPWFADGVLSPDMRRGVHPDQVQCCVLSNGEQANFEHDCRMFDYASLNCTARAMGQSRRCAPR